MKVMSLKNLLKSNIPRALSIMTAYVVYSFALTYGQYIFQYGLNSLTERNLRGFAFWLLSELGLELFAYVLLPIATFFFNKQVQEYLHQIRKHLMLRYYAEGTAKVSEMQNELGNNLKVLTDNYATPWITIWSKLLTMVLSIGALFSLHWSLILATAIIGLITICLPKLSEKKLAQTTAEATQKNESLLDTIKNWFAGLNELRRYKSAKRLNQAIGKSSYELARANVKAQKYDFITTVLNGFGNSLGQVGITFWAGILFFRHVITFGAWMVASMFASTIFNNLWAVLESVVKIKSTSKLRENLADLTKPVKKRSQNSVVCGVESRNLVVKYDQGETIVYPDFTVKKGDKVLLSGDSGTGKSTLFKVFLGQIKPVNGSVSFIDEKGQRVAPKRAQFGYIAQDASLFPDTIANNITMFNRKLAAKLTAVVQKTGLTADLAMFPNQAETLVDLDQDNLSGGQKQKIVLARAEIHDAKLLLLDEATSAIDSQTTNEIVSDLLKTDATIILIAHNFSPDLVKKFDYQIQLKSNRRGE